MYEMGQLFLHCVNQWKMETPAQKRKVLSPEELKLYKVHSMILFERSFGIS